MSDANYAASLTVETAVAVQSHRRLGGAIAEDTAKRQADVLMGWAESSYTDRAAGIGAYVEEFGYADTVSEFLTDLQQAIQTAVNARAGA